MAFMAIPGASLFYDPKRNIAMSETNSFARLSGTNVSAHIEKKGQFSYLSWPFAVAQLRLADASASWEVRRFNDMPYLKSDVGYFVEVAVSVNGITLSQIHPVLDGKNRPIAEPNAFDINTSIQRCLVKAIALHGLGLYIYAGEDLPTGTEEKPAEPKPTVTAITGKLASPAQLRFIERLIDETGSDLGRVLEFFNVSSINELTTQTASRAIRSLEKNRRVA
jgi:hypothetical protein